MENTMSVENNKIPDKNIQIHNGNTMSVENNKIPDKNLQIHNGKHNVGGKITKYQIKTFRYIMENTMSVEK